MKERFNSREKKTSIKNSVGRLLTVILLLLLQFYWLLKLILNLSSKYPIINSIIGALAILLVIAINSNKKNSSFKTPLMILILSVPVVGILLYFLILLHSNTRRIKNNNKKIGQLFNRYLKQDSIVFHQLEEKDVLVAGQFRYLRDFAPFPVYQNTYCKYFSNTKEAYESMICELEQAKKFIFMEYHAIEDKTSFEAIKNILINKSHEGVEIRILYDDIGSFVFVSRDFINEMNSYGISCRAFNPMMPFFNLFINNRDHRKITIIDGNVAFTGGFNLADEYFNITHPYGYWKDTGILIKGEPVDSFTCMFLEMWNSVRITDSILNCKDYFGANNQTESISSMGYISPYSDTPLDNESVGENVYINILNNSKKYCWFITPYLIITDELKRAFELASKRGVDVRIIVPGIPDKRLVYQITKSYYYELYDLGVRVFKYDCGFCHCKMCVSDDELSVIGTINLDYRSLYHHFENAVLLYNCDTILDIKSDFDNMFQNECSEIVDINNNYIFVRIIQSLLRLFAPLL